MTLKLILTAVLSTAIIFANDASAATTKKHSHRVHAAKSGHAKHVSHLHKKKHAKHKKVKHVAKAGF